MTEGWWQLTRQGIAATARPTGSATTLFTTFALADLSTERWFYHAQRLGTPPTWLASWDSALGSLRAQAKSGSELARIVYDPELSAIWLSMREAPPTPVHIVLRPCLGQWPSYTQKWWQRETYQRQTPTYEGNIRYERLLADERTGRVWETDTANLIIEKDGQFYTPDPTDAPLLWGTTLQQHIVTHSLVRQVLTLEAVQRADQIWICNAALGLRRARLAQP